MWTFYDAFLLIQVKLQVLSIWPEDLNLGTKA